MKSYCLLKGVVIATLLSTQVNAFSQDNVIAANPVVPQVTTVTIDSVLQKAAFNLLSFTGTNSSGAIILTWKTDSRSHFSGFTLERSMDETTFPAIGEVSVTSSNKTNSFTYADGKPLSGRNFYRLKMIDSSGSSTYSAVVSVVYAAVNNFQIHYDAASGTISLAGIEMGNTCQLKLYNCNGQPMLQKTVTSAAPSISINQLAHGLYVVYATDGAAAPVSQKIIW